MLDIFDKPNTCERMWPRLLSGLVVDALEANKVEAQATPEDAEHYLTLAKTLSWQRTDAVGDGNEYRCGSATGEQGAALVLNGTIVHGSIVATAQL